MVTNTTVSEPPIRAVAVVYLITLIHHIYGGLVFGSVERLILALVVTILFVATAWLSRLTTASLWARRAYWSLVAGFWIVLIGLYEGGFNHLLYLVLRSTAIISEETLERLYPAASDAMVSNDVFFQATGVLTVVASAALAFTVVAKGKRARTGQVGSA